MTDRQPRISEEEHQAFERDFSDLHDGLLSPERAAQVRGHLGACERCRVEYDKLSRTLGALSGLHRMTAPADFDESVAQTIHRRSAGRFFGRKAFGDRVPYEVLAILALALALAVFLLLRFSSTGSVHDPLRSDPEVREPAPGARDVLPPRP